MKKSIEFFFSLSSLFKQGFQCIFDASDMGVHNTGIKIIFDVCYQL